jgi:hypothetical protein
MAKNDRDSFTMTDHTGSKHSDKTRAFQSRPAVQVEFPREGDVIAQPSYTFQIKATPESDGMEVSIDKGAWMRCRESLGLWWYDWSGFDAGEHELEARTRMSEGLSTISAPRRFSVAP